MPFHQHLGNTGSHVTKSVLLLFYYCCHCWDDIHCYLFITVVVVLVVVLQFFVISIFMIILIIVTIVVIVTNTVCLYAGSLSQLDVARFAKKYPAVMTALLRSLLEVTVKYYKALLG